MSTSANNSSSIIKKGVDYAWGHPSGAAIAAKGYSFCCRYLSNTPSKNIDLVELNDLHANSLSVVLIWETSSRRPTEGKQAGIDDATKAKAQALALGADPIRLVLYFACDWDFSELDVPNVNAYFAGVCEVLPVSQVGVYGSFFIVKELLDAKLATYAWQTSAWSENQWDSRCNIKQVSYNVSINKVSCDINEACTDDFGQW